MSPDKKEGWARLKAGDGGASAIVIYDMLDGWPALYDDHSIETAVRHLEAADLVVGFRSEAFDVPCVEGLANRKIRLREHIDLYPLIVKISAQKGVVGVRGDFTLNSVCKRTLGHGKVGSGAHAPDLAREGRYGELFNYCLNDVRLTRDLFIHAVQNGGVRGLHNLDLSLAFPTWVHKQIAESLDV